MIEILVEIEQDLTTREEVNVDLQVVLENAIQTQKESDTCAQQTIRNAYARLVSVNEPSEMCRRGLHSDDR